MVDDTMLKPILALPEKYINMEDDDLRKEANPIRRDFMLRNNFWIAFEKAINSGTMHIHTPHVYNGVCPRQNFYEHVLANPAKLAWLIRPIREYESELELLLSAVTDRLWEIVRAPIFSGIKGSVNKPYKLDPKAADVVLKAAKMIEDRVKGMAVQRIAQKTEVTNRKNPEAIEVLTEEHLDKEIKQLEQAVKVLPAEIMEDDRSPKE